MEEEEIYGDISKRILKHFEENEEKKDEKKQINADNADKLEKIQGIDTSIKKDNISRKGKISYTEVYDILCHSNKNIIDKIPEKFIKHIKDNMDTEYVPNINYSIPINEQNLSEETKAIISIIYVDYLCDSEEKEKIKEMDRINLKKEEEYKEKKYSIENEFQKRKDNKLQKKEELITNKNILPTIERKWYQKILNFFNIKNNNKKKIENKLKKY